MAKQTLKEQYRTALIKKGWKVCAKQASRKYLALEHIDKEGKMFLGKAGAVRFGRVATQSYPVANKKQLLY